MWKDNDVKHQKKVCTFKWRVILQTLETFYVKFHIIIQTVFKFSQLELSSEVVDEWGKERSLLLSVHLFFVSKLMLRRKMKLRDLKSKPVFSKPMCTQSTWV